MLLRGWTWSVPPKESCETVPDACGGTCPRCRNPQQPRAGHVENVPPQASGTVAYFFFGASRVRASVAQELAAQVIGDSSFALPGEPSGVERESIGQLPSGFCVATRKSMPRWIAGRSAV